MERDPGLPAVLFLDHSAELGGAELYLLDVARNYRGTFAIGTFAGGSFRSRLMEENLPHVAFELPENVAGVTRESGFLADLLSVPAVIGLALRVSREARKYDVIFANTQKSLIIGAVASFLSRRRLVWNLHDILTTEHFSPLHIRAAVWFARLFAHRVIVNSAASQKAFVKAGGRVSNTSVVYNGFDFTRYAGDAAGRGAALRREYVAEGQKLAAIFSRLAPWKGQHVVIDAVSRLPDVHLLIVGDALFQEEEEYRRALEKQVSETGLSGRVHFLGFRNDIPELVNAADIVIHASTAPEPFGRVIVEGMAAGKPVIATAAGGALEILQDGVSGLLVPPGDSGAITEAVERIVGDEAFAGKLAAEGFHSARKRFSLPVMVGAIEHELASLHARKGR